MKRIFTVIILLTFFCSSVTIAADWRELKHGHEIDIASIEFVKPSNKRFWYRYYATENEFYRTGRNELRFEDYAYDLIRAEVNCNKRVSRVGEIITYSKAGEVVSSYDGGWFEFQNLVPDSMLEADYQYVCADKKTQAKTEFITRISPPKKQPQQQLPQAVPHTDEERDSNYMKRLNILCPEWGSIRVNPDFAVFLQQEVPFTRTTFAEALNKADSERDAQKVAEIYNAFKNSKAR